MQRRCSGDAAKMQRRPHLAADGLRLLLQRRQRLLRRGAVDGLELLGAAHLVARAVQLARELSRRGKGAGPCEGAAGRAQLEAVSAGGACGHPGARRASLFWRTRSFCSSGETAAWPSYFWRFFLMNCSCWSGAAKPWPQMPHLFFSSAWPMILVMNSVTIAASPAF